jgi:hypothetical protein
MSEQLTDDLTATTANGPADLPDSGTWIADGQGNAHLGDFVLSLDGTRQRWRLNRRTGEPLAEGEIPRHDDEEDEYYELIESLDRAGFYTEGLEDWAIWAEAEARDARISSFDARAAYERFKKEAEAKLDDAAAAVEKAVAASQGDGVAPQGVARSIRSSLECCRSSS